MFLGVQSLATFLSETIGAVAVVMLLGLSPRFRRAPVGFRAPGYEGWTALGVFGAALTLSFVLFPWQGLDSFVPVQLADLWPRLTIALIGAGVVALALLLRRQPLRSVLLGKQTLMASLQMGLALIFLSIFLRGKISALFDGIAEDQVTALFVWLGLCAAEEVLLRGFLQTRLIAWLGIARGHILSALLSVVWTLPLWLPGAKVENILIYAGLTLAQALLLGWLARRSGHLLAGVMFRTISSWLWMI